VIFVKGNWILLKTGGKKAKEGIIFNSAATDAGISKTTALQFDLLIRTDYDVNILIVNNTAAFGPVLGYLSKEAFGLKATYWIAALILLLLALQWIILRTRKSKLFNL